MPLSDEQIEAGLKAAEAATAGPWLKKRNGQEGSTFHVWRNDHAGELSPTGDNEGWACITKHVWGEANADLIIAARKLLSAALTELKDLRAKLTAEVERLRGEAAAALMRQDQDSHRYDHGKHRGQELAYEDAATRLEAIVNGEPHAY
jgi:hypothetical protein